MTFAQMLHRALDRYFGDEAFERRDRKQIEKIKETLRPEVYEEVFAEAWADVPESIRARLPDDSRDQVRERILANRPAKRSIDAATT